jgi:hypothetical protein
LVCIDGEESAVLTLSLGLGDCLLEVPNSLVLSGSVVTQLALLKADDHAAGLGWHWLQMSEGAQSSGVSFLVLQFVLQQALLEIWMDLLAYPHFGESWNLAATPPCPARRIHLYVKL